MVADTRGLRKSTALSAGAETYISWAVLNEGPGDIGETFFVDLYFDGVVVERWASRGMPVDTFGSIGDWDRLYTLVDVRPGAHTLKLVVDSTNLVRETDESDNEFERELTWEPPPGGLPAPTSIPNRLPDLVPFSPQGWGGQLIATSYAGDTVEGPLSVDVPTYVRSAIRNQGLSSTPGDVWTYIYFDGLLVDMRRSEGLPAESAVEMTQWAGLFEAVAVSPGFHTLRMVVDPNDLIAESSEDNNTFETEFTWGTGPVPPRPASTVATEPTPPVPLTLPNLVPGWSYGWDGPIVVSHGQGSFQDSALTVDRSTFIDVVVHNRSAVVANSPYSVDLYFDGERVHTFRSFSSQGASRLRFWEDWDGLSDELQVTEGVHTLRMVIDPLDAVEEANEADNVYEKTFLWSSEAAAAAEPVAYTEAELQDVLAGLPALLDDREPALSPGGTDRTEAVMRVADAGYYMMTGRSIKDERVDIFLLTHSEYLAWIDDDFAESFAIHEESEYASILARREGFKSRALGFKTRRFGKVAVVVDAERGMAEVINSLAHELGHMRQDFLNPAQSEADDLYALSGIQEAGAQQFQRAFWLALEEFTGLRLLEYPDFEAFHRIVDDRLDEFVSAAAEDEHSLGFLLQWLAVLDHPELADMRQELTGSGRLGAASALRLYGYLVEITPEAAQTYVVARLAAFETQFGVVAELGKSRLVADLDREGVPALRIPGLLMP